MNHPLSLEMMKEHDTYLRYDLEENDVPFCIAVVGGGLSGLASLWEIQKIIAYSKLQRRPIELTVFDPHGFDGRGIPYSAPHGKSAKITQAWEKLTLNVPADRMLSSSLDGGRPDFLEWLNSSNCLYAGQYADDAFVPRYVFGDFLEHIAKTVTDQLMEDQNVTFNVVSEKAKNPKKHGQKIELSWDGGKKEFDMVFGAMGHFRTMKLENLEGQKGYFRTPYNFDCAALNDRCGNSDVDELVLWGGELSIIDAITVSEEMGYTGNYSIITRAAEPLESKNETALIHLPPPYKRFCHLRDCTEGRIKIVYGFVHDTEIQLDLRTGMFDVPFTKLEGGVAEECTISVANLLNAALWEQRPTLTGGHYAEVDEHGVSVVPLKSELPCSPLVQALNNEGLIDFGSDGMMRSTHSAFEIIGSPLMVGRNDVNQKRWSANHSWDTAVSAVHRQFEGRLKCTNDTTPSARSIVLLPS